MSAVCRPIALTVYPTSTYPTSGHPTRALRGPNPARRPGFDLRVEARVDPELLGTPYRLRVALVPESNGTANGMLAPMLRPPCFSGLVGDRVHWSGCEEEFVFRVLLRAPVPVAMEARAVLSLDAESAVAVALGRSGRFTVAPGPPPFGSRPEALTEIIPSRRSRPFDAPFQLKG